MFFVGNRPAKITRDGQKVHLITGEKIPEAENFSDIRSLLKNDRIVCDYKDGEDLSKLGKKPNAIRGNPFKCRDVLESYGYNFAGKKWRNTDMFKVYAYVVEKRKDVELPEWFKGMEPEIRVYTPPEKKKAPSADAKVETVSLRGDLVDLGFDIPEDTPEEKIALVFAAAGGDEVDGRTIPGWAKDRLAELDE